MKIITGSTGTTHVTSNNDGEFNQGIFGKDLIVLDNGSHLSASIIDNNTIRVSDGDLIFQGRHALIEPNTTEDITIETGSVGKNRNDLIVARYTLDSATGYENITLEVVKGAETNGAASDPAIETGDIRTGALLAEVPLFRVKIENVAITGLEPLYTVTKDIMGLIADLQAENRALNTNYSKLNSDLEKVKVEVDSNGLANLNMYKYGEFITTQSGTKLNKTGLYGIIGFHNYLTPNQEEYLGFVLNGFNPQGSVPIPIKGLLYTQDQSVTQECVVYLKNDGGLYLSVPQTLKSSMFAYVVVNDVIWCNYNR